MDFESQAQNSSDDSSTSSKLVLYSFWQSSCSWRVRFALNLKGLSYEYRATNLGGGDQLSSDFERLNPLKYVPVLVDGPVVVSDSYAILLVGIKRMEMILILFESVTKNIELLNWSQSLRKCLFRTFSILTDLNLLVVLHFSCLVSILCCSYPKIMLVTYNCNFLLVNVQYLEEKYPQKALLPADLHLKSLNLQVASIVSSSIQPLIMLGLLKTMEEKFGPEERLPWAQSIIKNGFNALEKLLKDFSDRYALGDEVYMADVFLAPQISNAVGRFGIDMSKFPTLARIYESYKKLPEFQASTPERQPDALH